jgi:uncharacterized glyoxalase superfamily protein PhnB
MGSGGVQHDQLTGPDKPGEPAAAKVVSPATGDADDVFADRVNPVAACHPRIHKNRLSSGARHAWTRSTSIPGPGRRKDVQAPVPEPSIGWLPMITTHIMAPGAARAARWYTTVLGAEEKSRITLPDGRLIPVELWFGPSVVMMADEFPEHDALSPATTGCTSAVLYLQTSDVDAVWAGPWTAGRVWPARSRRRFGVNGRAKW